MDNAVNSVNGIATTSSGGDFYDVAKSKKLKQFIFNYVGLIPFFIFSFIFIAIPTGTVAFRAFLWNDGSPTLENFRIILRDAYLASLFGSLKLGFVSALTGSIFGILICYAVVISGNKRLQKIVSTASGVFANTGGVPLAFFFVAAIGN